MESKPQNSPKIKVNFQQIQPSSSPKKKKVTKKNKKI